MPDYFMDKNHNKERVRKQKPLIGSIGAYQNSRKSLMQMEYEQPIHIEHETESTDEETENPTEDSFRITF